MPSGLDRRTRLIHAIDALSLAKLLVLAVGAFVGTAAPLYAIGIVFWLPIAGAAVLVTLRWLGVPMARRVELQSFGGRLHTPPARLGLSLSEQLARESAWRMNRTGGSDPVTRRKFRRLGR
jgi:hypothetical protein